MMNCQRATKLIPLHVGNDLEPGLAGELKGHLRTCLGCTRTMRAYVDARDALQGHFLFENEGERVWRKGPSLWEGIRERLEEPGPGAPLVRRVERMQRVVRVAAAVVLTAGLGLVAGWRFGWFGGASGTKSPSEIVHTELIDPFDPRAGHQAGVVEVREPPRSGTLRRVDPSEFHADDLARERDRLLRPSVPEIPRRTEGELVNDTGRRSY